MHKPVLILSLLILSVAYSCPNWPRCCPESLESKFHAHKIFESVPLWRRAIETVSSINFVQRAYDTVKTNVGHLMPHNRPDPHKSPSAIMNELLFGPQALKVADLAEKRTSSGSPFQAIFLGPKGSGKTYAAQLLAEAEAGALCGSQKESDRTRSNVDKVKLERRYGVYLEPMSTWLSRSLSDQYARIYEILKHQHPILILDDVQGVSQANTLLAPFLGCFWKPAPSRHLERFGSVVDCSHLTVIITGQVDCFGWNGTSCSGNSANSLHYGLNTDREVFEMSAELSSSGSSRTVDDDAVMKFVDRWLGSTIRSFSKMIAFRSLNKNELYQVAQISAQELFLCRLCDECTSDTISIQTTELVDELLKRYESKNMVLTGRDVDLKIRDGAYSSRLKELKELCKHGRITALRFSYDSNTDSAVVEPIMLH